VAGRPPGEGPPPEHDWWTPEHPEDGLSWQEPGAASRSRRVLRAPARGRRLVAIRRRRVWFGLAGAILAVVVLVALLSGGDTVPGPPLPGLGRPARSGDPFAYAPSRQAAFVSRAGSGNAQVLFTKSPGGAIATAARVAAYRGMIDTVTRGTSIDPNLLEGLVFVESAGRPDAIAGNDPASAAGLTQILAATGQSLLGMHIDLAASRRLSARIAAAQAARQPRVVARLGRRRAAIDDRFAPEKALQATVRYLQIAGQRFGRPDLSFESYHMGIGNLQNVLSDYHGGTPVPYAQLYFDSAPDHNSSTWHMLAGFGDESSLYLWRILGAVQVMRLYRTDRAALARLSRLQVAFPSGALVLVAPDRVRAFADPSALSAAYGRRALLPLPRNAAALGLAYAASMGSPAGVPNRLAGLYRGLRPAALDLLIELAARVRFLSHLKAPLIVASTVIDAASEHRAGISDPPALTGYTFQIERRYAGVAQAAAFQAMLDRLQSLDLIAWIRGTRTIEITVAPDADRVIAAGV
jgi:hypothetical protein